MGDLVPATIVALALVLGLATFGRLHLSGRTSLLARAAGWSERISGLPQWAALPTGVAGGALLVAVFGFYWDVATHIDNGRDPGPFANTSHYFIIVGLAGVALAGYLSLLIGRDDDGGVRLRSRRLPVGGVLLFVCGAIALLGFPLDDTWHRIFGQDVTLWGPTHVQMVGGAALSTLAIWVLLVEGKRARPGHLARRSVERLDETFAAGAFLVGLSAFQGEFDYSVPQFRLLYQPVLLMLAAGLALVASRIRLGRGGALKAVAVFIGIRGVLSIVVGGALDHTLPHFPLYVVEALLVELVALRVPTTRQLTFGALAGVAIGTGGLAAEWAWSHVWMTFPWPVSLMPKAFAFGLPAAIAAGLLGGFIGRAFTEDANARERAPRWLPAVMLVTLLVVCFYPLPISTEPGTKATVALQPTGRDGWVNLSLVTEPRDLPRESEWFDVTAWQGGGSVVSQLVQDDGGTWHTTEAVPISGEWKTLIRLHEGSAIIAVPVYMPKDPVISAPGIPAQDHFVRPFVKDKELLLREAKTTSPWLSYVAYAILIVIILGWFAALGWGLWRLERGPGEGGVAARRRRAQPAVRAS